MHRIGKKKILMVAFLCAVLLATLAVASGGIAYAADAPEDTGETTEKTIEIWDGTVAESFAGGAGTEEDPYLISNGGELAYVSIGVFQSTEKNSAHFKLTKNIDLNDTSDWFFWGLKDENDTQIAPLNSQFYQIGMMGSEEAFCGTFDGNGYEISGVYSAAALFGRVGAGGVIKNLGVVKSYFDGQNDIAGIAAHVEHGGKIENCYTNSTVVGSKYAGGIAAKNWGQILNCYSLGRVKGSTWGTGGIVGLRGYGTVENCFATTADGTENVAQMDANYQFETAVDCGGYAVGDLLNALNIYARLHGLPAFVQGEELPAVFAEKPLVFAEVVVGEKKYAAFFEAGNTFSSKQIPLLFMCYADVSLYTDGAHTTAYDSTLPLTEDVKLYAAVGAPVQFGIFYSNMRNADKHANPASYTHFTGTFTLNNPEIDGYNFLGWVGSWIGETPQKEVTVQTGGYGTRVYTAYWMEKTYSISYEYNGGSASNPRRYTIETEEFKLKAPRRTWYKFVGYTWEGQDTPQKEVTISQGSTGDLAFTAHWKRSNFFWCLVIGGALLVLCFVMALILALRRPKQDRKKVKKKKIT